ncbi:hypothetical protein [Sinorhizobium fredii]|uniref:hypothetical protein n=1 Tax=Rhizobium fredii TaxID=380 RepID=UPI0033931CB4
MTRQEIIAELEALREPKRQMDLAIAQLFNYRREKVVVPTNGSKPEEIRVTWTDPNGGELQFGVVPRFTESLDAAKSLFDYALPGMAGGFSYHSGYAKATVADGEVVDCVQSGNCCLSRDNKGGSRLNPARDLTVTYPR